MENTFEIVSVKKTGRLELSPITLNDDYIKEWQIISRDFVCLTRDGELINNNLFRIGGVGTPKLNQRYFMLLVYKEDFYDERILKMSKTKNPKHLASHWCIIDQNGQIKFEANEFESNLHLYNDSCIYKLKNDYYNVETGYHYCQGYKSVESKNYLFVQNDYDKDETKRGVWKINKNDGTFEIL